VASVSATLERNLTRSLAGGGLDADYLHKRMTSQLVAFATQLRKASGLDELDELDEEPAPPHMFIRAVRQLALSRELELEDDPARHVPHLATMLSTAFSHLDVEGQPETAKRESANPRNARFMVFPRELRL
jgi:hypothetical protein